MKIKKSSSFLELRLILQNATIYTQGNQMYFNTAFQERMAKYELFQRPAYAHYQQDKPISRRI